jgi:hypothetical protein
MASLRYEDFFTMYLGRVPRVRHRREKKRCKFGGYESGTRREK